MVFTASALAWTILILTAEANQKLLLLLLAMHPEAKLDFAAAAEYFTKSTGVTCTVRAVQEQMKKLKKISKDDA